MRQHGPLLQVRVLEVALAEARAGRAADAAASRRLHEDQRDRLTVASRRVQTLVSPTSRTLTLTPRWEPVQVP